MNTSADLFFTEGCGRCSKHSTPECKVHSYTEELALLRQLLLSTGLEEDCKWGSPCYTLAGKNVVMLAVFKDYCSLSFFKGALLADSAQLLSKAGPNSQSMRLFKFTDLTSIKRHEKTITEYIFEAIEVEKSGIQIPKSRASEPIPPALEQLFMEDIPFKTAFEKLTPGRQRAYLLHFNGAKQEKTTIARIAKNRQRILDGYGMNDCICGLSKRMPQCDGSHKRIG